MADTHDAFTAALQELSASGFGSGPADLARLEALHAECARDWRRPGDRERTARAE